MSIATLADVEARLSAYLKQCATQGPVVIARNGKAVAVLLAPRDEDDLEHLLLSRSPRLQALLDKSRRSISAGKGLSHDAFWRAVGARSRRSKRASQRTGATNRRAKRRAS